MKLYGWIVGAMLTLSLISVSNVSNASMYAQCTQSNGMSPSLLNNIEDRTLIIKNAIEEASIDGYYGMSAVSTVVLNRWLKSRETIRELILGYKQFSWTLEEHKLKRTPLFYGPYWCYAEKVVYETVANWIADGEYLINGADHYARTDWIEAGLVDWVPHPAMHFRSEVGHHSYYEWMPVLKPKVTKIKRNNMYIKEITYDYR